MREPTTKLLLGGEVDPYLDMLEGVPEIPEWAIARVAEMVAATAPSTNRLAERSDRGWREGSPGALMRILGTEEGRADMASALRDLTLETGGQVSDADPEAYPRPNPHARPLRVEPTVAEQLAEENARLSAWNEWFQQAPAAGTGTGFREDMEALFREGLALDEALMAVAADVFS